MHQLYNKEKNMLSCWLSLMCFAVIIVIFIGGLTRLTESGLSITEWKPVSGIIPPIDSDSWSVEFEKYKQSPEYIKNNSGMSMTEFKSIYMLEFCHRLAGRIIGLLYVLPLIFFFLKGNITGRKAGAYIVVLILFLCQGAVGWYMVQSGLVSDPHVSHFRLASHLILAIFIYMILFWQLMNNSFDIMLLPSNKPLCGLSFWAILSIVLLLLQMILGAFVAGLQAGLVYNSFPLMGDSFVPHEISLTTLSLSSWSEPVFVQFIHRAVAYILFFVICIFSLQGIRLKNSKFSRLICYVMVALTFQIFTGIFTLICHVPIPLALLHQFGAVLLLSFLLWAWFLIQNSRSL